MAAHHRDKIDQWRPDQGRARQRQRTDVAIFRARRSSSPALAVSGKDSIRPENNPSSKQHSSFFDKRAPRPRSRERSRGRRRGGRSRSSTPPSRDDLYRPARTTDRSPRTSHYSPDRHHGSRLASPSPPRRLEDRDRNRRREELPARRAASPRRSDHDRAFPVSSSQSIRDTSRRSPRRRSPDRYTPSSRRSPIPSSSSYRPAERAGSAERKTRRERPVSPRRERPSSPRRSSPSYINRQAPPREERRNERDRPRRPHRQEEENRNRTPKRPRRSITPERRSPPRGPRNRQAQRDPRQQQQQPKQQPKQQEQQKQHQAERESQRAEQPRGRTREQESNMSYYGRGGSRGGRHHGGENYGHSPPNPNYYPIDHGPHGSPPFGNGRGGWPGYGAHGPPQVYANPSPYRQNSFPGQAPSPYYGPPVVPPPYAGSPPYPSPYPPQYPPPTAYRSNSAGHHQSPRSETSSRGNSRRGHYSNLSWTPATGSRGGKVVPPKGRPRDEDEAGEDEESPFRPSKALRAEDQMNYDDEEQPETTEPAANTAGTKNGSQPEGNKIIFGFKKMGKKGQRVDAGPTDISTLAKGRKPVPRNEKKLVKRIRPRPTLSAEMAASESVYFRRPGNESVVGSGTYGKVFRAIHVYTGEKVALKKIRMEGERDGFPVTAIREIKLLQSLKNPNVVRLQEVMVEKNDCYMVFEYLSHDLTGLLNHPTFKLEHSHRKHLAKQLFEGLDYLHKRGVLHRDIKAANILISNTGQLKIADFGLARFFAKRRQLDYTNRVITIWYRSPELLLGETQYGPAVDIWSAACVMIEIFTRHAAFPGNGGEIDQLDKIYNVLGTPTRTEWPGIVDMAWFELLRPAERKPSTFAEKYQDRVTPQAFELLKDMFAYDPTKRPSAGEVLTHPYFTEEEPKAQQAVELETLQGDWHEFESKALRKEKERAERKAKEAEHQENKRRLANSKEGNGAVEERRAKKPRLEVEPAPAEQIMDAPVSA